MHWFGCCKPDEAALAASNEQADAWPEQISYDQSTGGISVEADQSWRLKEASALTRTHVGNLKGVLEISPSTKSLPPKGEAVLARTRSLPPSIAASLLPRSLSETPVVRKDRKAMTMPAKIETRRVSITVSPEAVTKLERKKKKRKDTMKLEGSKARAVTDAELERVWLEKAECHVHGLMTEDQKPEDQRELIFFGAAQLPGRRPPCISCQKGCKVKAEPSPNQDNFSITYFKNGYKLACVFDGHGDCGHLVSSRTVQTVPYFLIKCSLFPSNIEGALKQAFESADKDVEVLALDEDWDVMGSGATATAVLWQGNQIWIAHCGDSRCVVGSVKTKHIIHETEDHKPESVVEKARIEASGGEVRTKTYDDGFSQSRIYIKGEDYPGLAMSRALGDVCVKDHGVIAVPEVQRVRVEIPKKPFFVVSSDGVWEFIKSAEVAEGIAKLIQQESAEVALEALHGIALERWEEEEGEYCDDITSILVQLT